jgi:hypothetical protein
MIPASTLKHARPMRSVQRESRDPSAIGVRVRRNGRRPLPSDPGIIAALSVLVATACTAVAPVTGLPPVPAQPDYDWERQKCRTLTNAAERDDCLHAVGQLERTGGDPAQYFYVQEESKRSGPLVTNEASTQGRSARSSSGSVIVTSGGITQPYVVLGDVHVDTIGVVNLGSALHDALFKSRFEQAAGGAIPTITPAEAFAALRDKAISQYGSQVDAVVNASYRAEHDGTVYADGLAVRFTPTPAQSAEPPLPRSAEARLKELKNLLEQKLISPKEYEHRRAEILKEI